MPLTNHVQLTKKVEHSVAEAVVNNERFTLTRCVKDACISEFFIIRVVHERKLANVELSSFTEKVDGITVKILLRC